MTKDRFVDPYDMPGEFEESCQELPQAETIPRKSAIDLYDLDLHDDFDWLAQPCVTAPDLAGGNGRANES